MVVAVSEVPATFVDHVVVCGTNEGEVGEVGGSRLAPWLKVVGLTPVRGKVASRKDAVPVAVFQSGALCTGCGATHASDIKDE